MNTPDLGVTIGIKKLPNPVGVASGTFGYGSEYESLMDLSILGALYTKAITLLPRGGNEIPRIIETPSGILNAIGLANVGVDVFVRDKLPFLRTLSSPIIANVAGSIEEEYIAVVEKLESFSGISGYEINISCPNVKHGGLSFGTDPAMVESLTGKLRAKTKLPLIIKLTPNVTDIAVIAKAAEAGGADAVSCINTLIGMVIDTKQKKIVLANKTGGLSGPAIRPIAVAMTYKVARSIQIPVIGIGGIMTADDALQFLLAGASAIQVGTGTFVDPSIPKQVHDGIMAYALCNKLTCIEDFHEFLP